MRAWWVLGCCACNAAFGLSAPLAVDALPLDAPFACPPIGTSPVFSPVLHEVFAGNCEPYDVFSTGYTVGGCFDPVTFDGVYESRDGGPLAPIAQFQQSATDVYYNPSVTADGSLMLVGHTDEVTRIPDLRQYHYAAEGWTSDGVVVLPVSGQIGPIIRDGGGWRTTVARPDRIVELTFDGASWQTSTTSIFADVTVLLFASLTEDGLRAIVVARKAGPSDVVYYTDRSSTAVPFTRLDPLDNVPPAFAPFIDATCAHIYVTGLDNVFYAQPL